MVKKEAALSFYASLALVLISLLLFPFYYLHQPIWAQLLTSSNGDGQQKEQQQRVQILQEGNNNLPSPVSSIEGLEEEGIVATERNTSNSSSYFIFPSQKQFFFPSLNATRHTDLAILNGSWKVENSRTITESLAGLDTHAPQMAFVVDHFIPSNQTDTKIHLRIYDPGVRTKPSPALVFVHGGGWTVGSIDDFDGSIRRLANSSGLLIAAMDYRLAPEDPFPAGLNDVITTVKWIKESIYSDITIKKV